MCAVATLLCITFHTPCCHPVFASPQATGLLDKLSAPGQQFMLFAPDIIAWDAFFTGGIGYRLKPLAAQWSSQWAAGDGSALVKQ